ncbi:MAG: hypothetical protein ACTSO2_15930 [Promethearchaeota archaeon]
MDRVRKVSIQEKKYKKDHCPCSDGGNYRSRGSGDSPTGHSSGWIPLGLQELC